MGYAPPAKYTAGVLRLEMVQVALLLLAMGWNWAALTARPGTHPAVRTMVLAPAVRAALIVQLNT